LRVRALASAPSGPATKSSGTPFRVETNASCPLTGAAAPLPPTVASPAAQRKRPKGFRPRIRRIVRRRTMRVKAGASRALWVAASDGTALHKLSYCFACCLPWHAVQSVTRFSLESVPPSCGRTRWWTTSRASLLPQRTQAFPSRCFTHTAFFFQRR
jgi:hypothetical protein